MEVLENWDLSLGASFEGIEPPSEVTDSLFVLEGVAPEFTPILIKGKRVHGFATLRFDF
jgi:hypothetical protein